MSDGTQTGRREIASAVGLARHGAAHCPWRTPVRTGATSVRRRVTLLMTGTAIAFLAPMRMAQAHVRWFTEDKDAYADQQFPRDLTSALLLAGAVSFIALAVYFSRAKWAAKVGAGVQRVSRSVKGLDWRLVAFLTGLMLVANSIMGVFLAPNLDLANDNLQLVGSAAQMIVGVLLLVQISFTIPGILILLTLGVTTILIPLNVLVDYVFEFVALSIALIVIGPGLCALDRRLFKRLGIDTEQLTHLPLPIIRIGVGLTLVALAIHNKLLNPGLTLAFLDEFKINFMPYLGFTEFTNLHFTLAAGLTELTVGLLILFGVATRFVTAVLSIFFVITLFVIGPIELIGHAPLIGIAVLLILRGGGQYRFGSFLKPAHQPATHQRSQRSVAQT